MTGRCIRIEEASQKFKVSMQDICLKLRGFIESEMRSCSMDFGCITPLYVYRMLGGAVAIEDIATAMEEVGRKM